VTDWYAGQGGTNSHLTGIPVTYQSDSQVAHETAQHTNTNDNKQGIHASKETLTRQTEEYLNIKTPYNNKLIT
jgi:hypothetical protein